MAEYSLAGEAGSVCEPLKQCAAWLGLEFTPGQLERFALYHEILRRENEKYTLTAITAPAEVAIKHFVDSLALLKFWPDRFTLSPAGSLPENTALPFTVSLLDIGSGAGFPGLPLKIVLPGLHVHLNDSVQKKVKFLELAGRELGLPCPVLPGRAEELGRDKRWRDGFQLVVSRAVAALNVLAEYCLPLVRPGGFFIAWKGAGVDEEVAAAGRALAVLNGRLATVHKFKLPLLGDERALVVVQKTAPTPAAYPRRVGLPAKKPL
ncbi:16S rRNA (guanine(527)-N(7))-methyltransferase RsmG [Desulfurispora thermophila]|uniref:16S rRNA (guanine(527)-N(7))-methyltransferase RsmG n=1 Tax=Desulfurispora thermophila TaxID=265470 RepID=UPI000363433A|nr:16S rRNA (guanine(527)-N(7))-methyltransferase RsmG [Desulfurispora thermophila]